MYERSSSPKRPSRLRCSFAWLDEIDARFALAQEPKRCIEVCEPVDPHANQFVADFNLLSSGSRYRMDKPFLPTIERIARQYWTGDKVAKPEILIESDLRVIRVLP
ncbi:hypothetical protein [Variovorax saccharolyticus]|uniref:hypothetical protein n=1 Tax=Variovorax saccharolyticus TaxID=3053516 RepID=UPI0025775E28|nr:hypothetical protein [Variovorax sp. J31P216]MDM0029649.1 hypothetical protein [Variovorax sp. J31P216]